MTAREDTIERIERCLELTSEKSITVTIPRLTAERAVSMLKEQEAVKPIHKCWNGRFTQLNRINGYAFCPYCGKPIDWGKNVLL